MQTTALFLLAAFALLAVGFAAYRYGWQGASVAGSVLAGLAALLLRPRTREAAEVVEPPRGPSVGAVRRTAGDIIERRAKERADAIAAQDADDVAATMRGQR